jgi:hypothetical protein
MQRQMVETLGTGGVRLGALFERQADRFQHSISLLEAGGTHWPLLESLEGSPADDWPPSPPLQNLHCESLPDGSRVALLVGMAGAGHWSASIGPRADENCLVFDVACRAGAFGGQVGTSYRVAAGVVVESVTRDLIRLLVAGHSVELAASQEQATRCELAVTENEAIRMHPATAIGATRRWLYEVTVQR